MKQVALALTTLVLTLAVAFPLGAEIVERVLVKVNGDILTKTELEQRQIYAIRQRNPQMTDADVKNDASLKKMLDEVTPDVLVDAIDEMLLLQRGRELGYKLSDDQFTAILDNIKKENKLTTDEQFQNALKQEGMTLPELRKSIERRMVIERVQQVEVMQKVAITEEDAKRYYAEHPGDFTKPSMLTLREILLNVPESKTPSGEAAVNVAADEETQKRAEQIRERVTTGGEDFGRVAEQVSAAPSKANGGLIGPIERTELAPALGKIVDALKPGEVSQPIRTPRGYQLIKLESATPPVVQPFEEVRDLIADKVYAEKRRGEVQRYLDHLRVQAIIEWESPELQRLYEQRLKTLAERPAAANPS